MVIHAAQYAGLLRPARADRVMMLGFVMLSPTYAGWWLTSPVWHFDAVPRGEESSRSTLAQR